MSLTHKSKTAFTILKTQGVSGVVKVLKAKLDSAYRPDEAEIAFEVLSKTINKGIMIDVGAHHGGSLAPFAQAGWQVYAFEPHSGNRAILTNSFGNLPNIHIDDRAVSDHLEDEVTFYKSVESTGVSGLCAFLPSHKAAEKVSVTTLQRFLVEQKLEKQEIDFLKIDTEGFDLMVLKGFPWNEKQPRMILCEFEDSKTMPLGYSFQDLAAFLVERGYKLVISEWYPVKRYGGLHDWKRFTTYPCTLEDPTAWGNIFAVKDDNLYQRLLEVSNN